MRAMVDAFDAFVQFTLVEFVEQFVVLASSVRLVFRPQVSKSFGDHRRSP